MVRTVKMVIAVRKDLDLGKGKIAAQVAHAAVLCALKAEKFQKKLFAEWIRTGQKKIVIRLDNADALLELKKKIDTMGILTEAVFDAGHTQVEPGTLTCIGIGPVEESDIEPVTGGYPLL
ncbi:MAG: peptidyl-tRNA hydrolase Pth2 [Candidatus Thermoplasmatota archaeon]|jgi:PTH2 family peptidyl-tRNA hydrolase|nr:peptidyl-tRNA hydrolase Pth2 [Candidatus Thermoplasmatota archaeon]